jgi:hypothetical protein
LREFFAWESCLRISRRREKERRSAGIARDRHQRCYVYLRWQAIQCGNNSGGQRNQKDKVIGKKKEGFRVEQDGVNRSLAEWTANTFELPMYHVQSFDKRDRLFEVLSRSIIVPEMNLISIRPVASSVYNRSGWKEAIKMFAPV